MSIIDNFPPPSLDSSKWTAYTIGSTVLQVGFPVNGCFPHGVDDHGDHVYVESKGKITFTANRYFLAKIFYGDVYGDAEQNIKYYFGFRSNQEDMLGNPLFGIDVMLRIDISNTFLFQKRVITGGVETIENLIPDPTLGSNGGFQVVRNGTIYSLYYYDGVWSHLDDVDLGFKGAGYVRFGVYAENPALAYFPWVTQT